MLLKEKSELSKKISKRIFNICLIFEGRKTVLDVAKTLDITERYVRKLMARFKLTGKDGLQQRRQGRKKYHYDATRNDYFISRILPSLKLNRWTRCRIDNIRKAMLGQVRIKDVALRLGISERSVYALQEKSYTEGLWQLLPPTTKRMLLMRHPCLKTNSIPLLNNIKQDKEIAMISDANRRFCLGETDVHPNDFFIPSSSAIISCNCSSIKTVVGQYLVPRRTLYINTKEITTNKENNLHKEKSLYSFLEQEGSYRNASHNSKAKGAIEKLSITGSEEPIDEPWVPSITGPGKPIRVPSYKPAILPDSEKPRAVPPTQAVPPTNGHIFNCVPVPVKESKGTERDFLIITSNSFLHVELPMRPASVLGGSLLDDIDLPSATVVNCSTCGTQDKFSNMYPHSHFEKLILCYRCKSILKGSRFNTLWDMLELLEQRVLFSRKRTWRTLIANLRNYAIFLDLPIIATFVDPEDKCRSFNTEKYYNPFMEFFVLAGKEVEITMAAAAEQEQITDKAKAETREKLKLERKEQRRVEYLRRREAGEMLPDISYEEYESAYENYDREWARRKAWTAKLLREEQAFKDAEAEVNNEKKEGVEDECSYEEKQKIEQQLLSEYEWLGSNGNEPNEFTSSGTEDLLEATWSDKQRRLQYA